MLWVKSILLIRKSMSPTGRNHSYRYQSDSTSVDEYKHAIENKAMHSHRVYGNDEIVSMHSHKGQWERVEGFSQLSN